MEHDWKQSIDTAQNMGRVTYRIRWVAGPLAGRSVPLQGQMTIGREPDCSIVLPASTQGVSRKHCRIAVADGKLYIEDLGSAYGTIGNGIYKIPAQQAVIINPGDRISLGSEEVAFVIERDETGSISQWRAAPAAVPQKKPAKKKTGLILGIIAIILVITAAAVFFLINKGIINLKTDPVNGRYYTGDGMLDYFAKILQTDFNPSWSASFHDLVSNYKEGIVPRGKDSENYDSLYYIEIKMMDYTYGCGCRFDKGELVCYSIGDVKNNLESSDAFGNKTEGHFNDLVRYIEENVDYLEKNNVTSNTGFKNEIIGTVYHLPYGRTIFVYTGSSLVKENIIIVFPTEVNNGQYLNLVGILARWELMLGDSSLQLKAMG